LHLSGTLMLQTNSILNAQKLKILLQMLLHTDDVPQKQLQPTNSKVYRQV